MFWTIVFAKNNCKMNIQSKKCVALRYIFANKNSIFSHLVNSYLFTRKKIKEKNVTKILIELMHSTPPMASHPTIIVALFIGPHCFPKTLQVASLARGVPESMACWTRVQ